eukprot:829929-Pelagomonas_calceolata.AAC.1
MLLFTNKSWVLLLSLLRMNPSGVAKAIDRIHSVQTILLSIAPWYARWFLLATLVQSITRYQSVPLDGIISSTLGCYVVLTAKENAVHVHVFAFQSSMSIHIRLIPNSMPSHNYEKWEP